ncbi:hypothetical protein ElyMa_003857900 [Elysia marginata]|uniref:Uncharacterized protein n=1 Tax=Elysia marginata TaxID=1093978 RepID=A0AAV4FI70_9GAST|nr:hypothetical protein ElyMa_003857900 [Elysia marginata]
MEFQEQGQTVNSGRYISTQRTLKLRLRRVGRDKDSILHTTCSPAHQSLNSGRLKSTLQTAPILPPLTIICFPTSISTWRAIYMTTMRKLSQRFPDDAVDSLLNSSLTAYAK